MSFALDSLNRALRLLRVFHDLTQNKTAEDLGISAPYLSQIEAGKKTPSIEVLEMYSRVFDVPVSSILILAERIERDEFSYTEPASLVSPKVLRVLEWMHEKQKPMAGPEGGTPRKGASSERSPSSRKRRQRAS